MNFPGRESHPSEIEDRRAGLRSVPARFLALWTEARESGRWVVVAALVFSVAYSIAVLVAVATTGDIGLRCVLGQEIHVVEDHPWRDAPGEVAPGLRSPHGHDDRWSGGPPEPGSTLLGVGPWRVGNYHEYVLAMRKIRGSADQWVDVRWQREPGAPVERGQVRIETPPLGTYLWSIVWFLQEMIVFGVGAWVFWRRPRDESAMLFFWMCVATVGAFMAGYHWTKIVVYRPLIYLFAPFALFLPILSLHFYLVFPRTNPLLVLYRRTVLRVLYGLPVAALAAIWGSMWWSALATDRGSVQRALDLLQTLVLGYVWLAVGVFMLCLGCLLYSFLRARTRDERNQVQWILLATLLAVGPIAYLLWDSWNAPERLGMTRSAWPMFIVSLLYTAAYATSITRYRLMQAEAILSRGVLYVLVSLGAGLLYTGVLVVFTLLLGERTPTYSIEAVVAGVTAVVIFVLTELARLHFHRAIDRRFDREKTKFDVAMRKMSRAVGSLVDQRTLSRRLLEATTEVLRPEWGAIYLSTGNPDPAAPLALAACEGPEPDVPTLRADIPLVVALRQRPTILRSTQTLGPAQKLVADALITLGGELAAPLEAEGALLGVMVLGPKRDGRPYEDEELAFLGALGSLAALALRSAGIQATLEGLNHDLRDKVEKITEQQRRILILQDQLADRAAAGSGPGERAGRTAPPPADAAAFSAIRGSSQAVHRMVDLARKVAASPSAVLIRGESGTGKELLAEAIHRASPRAGRPFVQVHCAALSQNLLESELFGHVRGAFTGADRDRVGRFQQADGGTLFLDEIGDINWEVQTKLLRVLQEMAFERVGSSQTISVDVRIVAATHQDLEALIQSGRFREDLYYRLNVISLRTPALRERREDVFELAVHFLNVHARRAGKPVTHLDDAAIEALVAYDWPGNVRELENIIERAVVLADGPAVTLADLPPEVRRPQRRRRTRDRAAVLAVAGPAVPLLPPDAGDPPPDIDEDDPADEEFDAYERRRLLDALQEAGGNKSSAARLLAMPRSTFFSKLKKHGLA